VEPGPRFDVVFIDTCLGGSTVAAQAAATSRAGLSAFYLADYAVNPLGVKTAAEVRAALERWVCIALPRTGTLVVACNTASVLLEQLPDLVSRAEGSGLRVLSMVRLLDRALAIPAATVEGQRVCLMGTRFTTSQPVYRDRLLRAGAAEVLPLAATRTEHAIAYLRHTSEEGRREIADEVGDTVRRAHVVVLACTLFPLVGPLLLSINPACRLLDPAAGIAGALTGTSPLGTNRLTIALSGRAIPLDDVRRQAGDLFPGWDIASIEEFAGPDGAGEHLC
jgi:glutamate racemase